MKSPTDLRDRLAWERTAMAAERTVLSYVRTALAFLAGGAGVLHLLPGAEWTIVGITLLAGGALVGAGGFLRYRRAHRILTEYRARLGPGA